MDTTTMSVAMTAWDLHEGGLTYREVDEMLNLPDRFPTGRRFGKNGEVYAEVAYFLTKAPEVRFELARRDWKRIWNALMGV